MPRSTPLIPGAIDEGLYHWLQGQNISAFRVDIRRPTRAIDAAPDFSREQKAYKKMVWSDVVQEGL